MEKKLVLKNKISEISRLPNFVHDLEKQMQLAAEEVDELNLVLEEVVANIVRYAYPKGVEGSIEVRATWRGRHLVVVVTDKGTAFDPTQVKSPDLELTMEEMSVGGFGIFLVRQLMDEVRYQRLNENNMLIMEKTYMNSGAERTEK